MKTLVLILVTITFSLTSFTTIDYKEIKTETSIGSSFSLINDTKKKSLFIQELVLFL
jgi:hypothetical protein